MSLKDVLGAVGQQIDDDEAELATLEQRVAKLEAAVFPTPSPTPDPQPSPAPAPSPSPTPTPVPEPFAAMVATGSGALSFTVKASDATRLDDYVGELVHEYRARYVLPDLSGSLVFCRSIDGAVSYVIFENGEYLGDRKSRLGFTLTLDLGDGSTSRSVACRFSRWGGTWRCPMGTQYPVNADRLAALASHPTLPRLDKRWLAKEQLPKFKATVLPYTEPMSLAGMTAGVSAGGDRNDIGLVTEWISNLLLKTPADADYQAAVQTMLNQSEACGSQQTHVRAKDGGPFDCIAFPKASMQWDECNSNSAFYAPNLVEVSDKAIVPPTDLPMQSMNSGHTTFCAAVVGYLLTDDPYYLQMVQDQAAFAVFSKRGGAVPPAFGIVHQETRDWCWGLRSVMHALLTAPANPPSWLRAASYWQQIHDAAKAQFNAAMAATIPGVQTFRAPWPPAVSGVYMDSLFIDDYCLSELLMMQLSGQNWVEQIAWLSEKARIMALGEQGYPWQMGVPEEIIDIGKPQSWGDLWPTYISGRSEIDVTKLPPDDFCPPGPGDSGSTKTTNNTNPPYQFARRAVLALLARVATQTGDPRFAWALDYWKQHGARWDRYVAMSMAGCYSTPGGRWAADHGIPGI